MSSVACYLRLCSLLVLALGLCLCVGGVRTIEDQTSRDVKHPRPDFQWILSLWPASSGGLQGLEIKYGCVTMGKDMIDIARILVRLDSLQLRDVST